MKILGPILLSLLILSCSKTREEKAITLIKSELSTTMNDYKSYEPVGFGKIDSTFSEYPEDVFGISIEDTVPIDNDFKRREKLIEKYKKEEEQRKQSFKPKLIGFRMSHRFRGKNAMGATILNEYNFYFDIGLKEIIKTEDKLALLEKYNKQFDESIEELKRLKSIK